MHGTNLLILCLFLCDRVSNTSFNYTGLLDCIG